MSAAQVESALERANRLTRQARDMYMESPANESFEAIFALVAAVEGLHEALLTVCDFYNQRITELQESILILQNGEDA